ncbi:MAG: hypothetical protein ACHQD9_01000 [Chitinophagales bacterium]
MNHLRLSTLSFLLLFCLRASSQPSWECFGGGGTTVFFSDLGNEAVIPVSSMHYGASVGVKKNLFLKGPRVEKTSLFAVSAQVNWLRVGYDETKPLWNGKSGNELPNFYRGLNVRNDLLGVEMRLIYNFEPWGHKPFSTHKFSLYFFGGPGVFYSNPRADLFRGSIDISNRYYYWTDGTLRDAPQSGGEGNVVKRDGKYETVLRDWFTEGQTNNPLPGQSKQYGLFQIGFPHGGGIKQQLGPNSYALLEACFFDFPFTDYLDDCSNRYATYDEIAANFPNDQVKQELAKYITDPSGFGSDGENGVKSSPRGNPKKFDWINYMNLQFSFGIDKKGVKSFNQRSKRGGPAW